MLLIYISNNFTQMATLYGPHCLRKNDAPRVWEKRMVDLVRMKCRFQNNSDLS